MRIQHEDNIQTPGGLTVKTATQAQYLGSLLTVTGNTATAVGKRIGEAKSTFDALCEVWKHANINKHRKVEVYRACVVSKLCFSLECEALRQRDKERLNAFHCRCLRKILKIQPSWISHVPNNVVLATASSKPLADQVLFQQLVLFGKIAKLDNSNFLRQLTFEPSSLDPTKCVFRRRGRPRLSWQSVLYGHAVNLCPLGLDQLRSVLLDNISLNTWRRHLIEHL